MIHTNTNLRKNQFFSSGNKEGAYNFSMKKSEYVPMFTTFDSKDSLFASPLFLNKEGLPFLNINKYLGIIGHSTSFSTVVHQKIYFEAEKNFLQKVVTLDKAACYFDNQAFSELYTRSYKSFSCRNAFEGRSFSVKDIKFGGVAKTVLISQYNNIETIHYLFTFKTKFLLQLQKALVNGESVKSHWFTVFITPEIPGVNNSRGYSKPFKDTFITPFINAGIEIVYTNRILEQLSYTNTEPNYKFTFSSKKRGKKAEEMCEILKSFQSYELDKILLQQDWELGINSQERFTEWLLSLNYFYLKSAFETYIDENYYNKIPLETGLMRSLSLSSSSVLQVYNANLEEWEDDVDSLLDKNQLTMIFTVFEDLVIHNLPNVDNYNFDTTKIKVEFRLYQQIYPYTECNIVYDVTEKYYYQIANYKSIMKNFNAYTPSKIPPTIQLNMENTYYFDNTIGTYIRENDILGTSSPAFNNFTDYITTLEEFKGDKTILPYDCIVYFWDVRVLFLRIKGFLVKWDPENALICIENLLKNIDSVAFITTCNYEEKTVKSILRTLKPSMLINNQALFITSYYTPAITSNKELGTLDIPFSSAFRTNPDQIYSSTIHSEEAPLTDAEESRENMQRVETDEPSSDIFNVEPEEHAS